MLPSYDSYDWETPKNVSQPNPCPDLMTNPVVWRLRCCIFIQRGLRHVFRKHVKPKKQHELVRMAALSDLLSSAQLGWALFNRRLFEFWPQNSRSPKLGQIQHYGTPSSDMSQNSKHDLGQVLGQQKCLLNCTPVSRWSKRTSSPSTRTRTNEAEEAPAGRSPPLLIAEVEVTCRKFQQTFIVLIK